MDLYTGGSGFVVFNYDCDQILLGKRTDGQGWALPAGKRIENELPLLTAIRETKEEFGITIDILNAKYFGKIYAKVLSRGKYINVISNIFYTDKFEGEIVPQESEVEEIRWCDFQDILDLDKIYPPSLASINRFVYPIWEKSISKKYF